MQLLTTLHLPHLPYVTASRKALHHNTAAPALILQR